MLGDVVVAGWDAPRFAVPVFQNAPALLVPPAAFERVWTNLAFAQLGFPVTYWLPIAPYGYTCVGAWAAVAVGDAAAVEPPRDSTLRCVHTDLVRRAPEADIALVASNSGASALENGNTVSLWAAATDDAGAGWVLPRSFVPRRDVPDSGPGYNKFFYVAAEAARA